MNYDTFKTLSMKNRIEFWNKNLLVAHTVFLEMSESSIVKDLGVWCLNAEDCGSPACFGGWVARMPYFKNLGIRTSIFGSPKINDSSCGYYLFGNYDIFEPRCLHESSKSSDKELILKRIESTFRF